jgi:flavorubredoxin
MLDDHKSPQYMTSQELEEAIRKHREYAKRLLAEARARRNEAEKVAKKADALLRAQGK